MAALREIVSPTCGSGEATAGGLSLYLEYLGGWHVDRFFTTFS